MATLTQELSHRFEITHWKTAVGAGAIAGLVFLILEMAMVAVFAGASPWAPPRMMAAIVLGEGVLPPPATFGLGIFIAALVVHFALSIIYALILAPVIENMNAVTAMWTGVAAGLVLYLVNFFLFTEFFPWFANARNWITVFAHLVFGGVLGYSYAKLAHRRSQP